MAKIHDLIKLEMAEASTEHQALLVKYLGLGRQLEREELVRSLRTDFQRALADVDAAAAEIEAYEDAEVAKLELLALEGPIKAEVVGKFRQLLDEVDRRHTAVVRDKRNPAFRTIFENYLPSIDEAP